MTTVRTTIPCQACISILLFFRELWHESKSKRTTCNNLYDLSLTNMTIYGVLVQIILICNLRNRNKDWGNQSNNKNDYLLRTNNKWKLTLKKFKYLNIDGGPAVLYSIMSIRVILGLNLSGYVNIWMKTKCKLLLCEHFIIILW